MDFRPPVDRRTMQIRRTMQFTTIVDPPPRDWWEAATIGEFDLTRFERAPRWRASGGQLDRSRHGSAVARFARPGGGNPRPVRRPGPPPPGVGYFSLGEAFKQLMNQGVGSVERIFRLPIAPVPRSATNWASARPPKPSAFEKTGSERQSAVSVSGQPSAVRSRSQKSAVRRCESIEWGNKGCFTPTTFHHGALPSPRCPTRTTKERHIGSRAPCNPIRVDCCIVHIPWAACARLRAAFAYPPVRRLTLLAYSLNELV